MKFKEIYITWVWESESESWGLEGIYDGGDSLD